MATRTDQDYADMVNPYLRAEEEAEQRGYRAGFWSGIFSTLCGIIGLGMLLVALDARGATKRTWTHEESFVPVRASQRGATVSICQNDGRERTWTCFYAR